MNDTRPHPVRLIPDDLREALSASGAAHLARGTARFRATAPKIPRGWSWRGRDFSFARQHDEDLVVFLTIEDDVADADLLDAIDPSLLERLQAITGASLRREVPRPPTYHVSVSRGARAVSPADLLLVVGAFLPRVPRWEQQNTGESPPPAGVRGGPRNFVHLFAPVAPSVAPPSRCRTPFPVEADPRVSPEADLGGTCPPAPSDRAMVAPATAAPPGMP